MVLDEFFGEEERLGLMGDLGAQNIEERGNLSDQNGIARKRDPDPKLWERNTADDAQASKTWGLKSGALDNLMEHPSHAMLEIQSRLVHSFYPLAILPRIFFCEWVCFHSKLL